MGLRQRKKQQTRRLIFETASRLFAERGFDGVTVAEVARAAQVSELTVFNYFPTKEDLFYEGMEVFEERLLDSVRERARGESALTAFRRAILESTGRLASDEAGEVIAAAAKLIHASPALASRELEVVARYTRLLAELLAAETGGAGLAPDDVETAAIASALMGVHRALVAYVRASVLAGRRGSRLVKDTRSQALRAFARLEAGLGDYAVKSA